MGERDIYESMKSVSAAKDKRTSRDQRRRGEDTFGKFTITGGPCTKCGQGAQFTIKYAPKSFTLPKVGGMEVDVSKTILQSTDNYLGLNCGCYAKFHRQVAHIFDTIKLRSEKG